MRTGRRVTPPLNGDILRKLRIEKRLTQSQVGRWYGRDGVSYVRIRQIEMSYRVNKIVESLYRAAVDTAVFARDKKVGAVVIRPEFANLKTTPEGGW